MSEIIAIVLIIGVIGAAIGWFSGARGRWRWTVIVAVLCWIGYWIWTVAYEPVGDSARLDLGVIWAALLLTTAAAIAAVATAARRSSRHDR